MTMAYKVREYHVDGPNKGNVKREIVFESLTEALVHYLERLDAPMGYEPTLWYNADYPTGWIRLTYI